MTAPHWYLAQTKARQERAAEDNLVRQGYATWLPWLRIRRRRGTRIEPMFPGYVFIQLCPERDDFGPIRSTISILKLVQFGHNYARVPDALVAALKAREDAGGVCDAVAPVLTPGTRVEIISGALAGYEAVVSGLRGRERVALLLDIADRHLAIVAPQASVNPVD